MSTLAYAVALEEVSRGCASTGAICGVSGYPTHRRGSLVFAEG